MGFCIHGNELLLGRMMGVPYHTSRIKGFPDMRGNMLPSKLFSWIKKNQFFVAVRRKFNLHSPPCSKPIMVFLWNLFPVFLNEFICLFGVARDINEFKKSFLCLRNINWNWRISSGMWFIQSVIFWIDRLRNRSVTHLWTVFHIEVHLAPQTSVGVILCDSGGIQ